MEFEWDEAKRLSNIDKHWIDFLDARRLFDGRPVFRTISAYRGEERYLTVGFLGGQFVTAVWTRRNGTIRFISVRHARRNEIASILATHEY
ncbi:MAG TPA: BrnT family toxin [Thermomicrobiales bacterium]|nr:BrnT family toxin [Thermomicrobiales bacterium]